MRFVDDYILLCFKEQCLFVYFVAVENLTHKKTISLNDQPLIYVPQQTYLSNLVDGYDAPSRCTTIDSSRCRNGEPHIIIDLSRNYDIHGVIIQQLDTCE